MAVDFPQKTWNFINKEGPIDICWPAKGPFLGKEAQHLKAIRATLHEQGFPWVRLHEEDLDSASSFGGYYGHTEIRRAQSLQNMIADETCQVFWAGAGGFGALSVLDYFEKNNVTLFGKKIRPFVGFSNITALHLWAAQHHWPSLHACVAGSNLDINSIHPFTPSKTPLLPLLKVLTGEIQELTYSLDVLNPEVIAQTPLRGSVIGGNLSLIQRSQGSPTALDGKGRFIFLEDTPEYFNRTDELLCSLARAGTFDHARAIIFGHLPIVEDDTGRVPQTRDVIQHFDKTVLRARRGLNLPILYSDQFGHGPFNHVLPFGTKAQLTFQESTTTAMLTVHVNAPADEI